MAGSRKLRIGIAGCGRAGRLHLDLLLALAEVEVVGCADPDRGCAESLAERIGPTPSGEKTPVLGDHRELIGTLSPDALCIFTPHFWHYRLAMDAPQAGCHIFTEKPLSTDVQEAADIVGLAQGGRLKVGVGHQYRLCPSLQEARRLLKAGAVGKIHLITALMARPWVDASEGSVKDWRFDPGLSGGGVLTDAGHHPIDALFWTTGQTAEAVYAVQTKQTSGLDLVTAASVCLRDRTPATLGSPAPARSSSSSLITWENGGGCVSPTSGWKSAEKPSPYRPQPEADQSKKPSMGISCPQSSVELHLTALPRRRSRRSGYLMQ